MERKVVKTLTLEVGTIEYIEKQRQLENRTFSNMIDSIISRYRKISQQIDQGTKIDIAFSPK